MNEGLIVLLFILLAIIFTTYMVTKNVCDRKVKQYKSLDEALINAKSKLDELQMEEDEKLKQLSDIKSETLYLQQLKEKETELRASVSKSESSLNKLESKRAETSIEVKKQSLFCMS